MAVLSERVTPAALRWLEEAKAAIARDPAALRSRFAMVGRKVGRAPVDPDADPADVHAITIDDLAREELLLAAGQAAHAELADLYRFGDAAERRGVLRALPALGIGTEAFSIVDDALRSNDTRLVAAALGPWATENLEDAAYDQAVLKCVFIGVPITPLDGLVGRSRPATARKLAAFAHERVAAGRDLPSEVWTVIDRFPPEAELAAIHAELNSEFSDRREAAERALADRKGQRSEDF